MSAKAIAIAGVGVALLAVLVPLLLTLHRRVVGRDSEKPISTKQCSSCYSIINQAARKCPQCQAFQNWRRVLDASNATVALLLAFISVLTIGGEPIAKFVRSLQPRRADVRVIVSGADLDNVYIVAQNSGNVIAAIGLHADVDATTPNYTLPWLRSAWLRQRRNVARPPAFVPLGARVFICRLSRSPTPD